MLLSLINQVYLTDLQYGVGRHRSILFKFLLDGLRFKDASIRVKDFSNDLAHSLPHCRGWLLARSRAI
jgi:hypothetical protein